MLTRLKTSILLVAALVLATAPLAFAVPDGAGNEVFPSVNVGINTTSPRAKLEVDPQEPQHLRTVRGVGYRFDV